MRYLVILAAIGRRWQAEMRASGVADNTIESWGVYWDQLVRTAGSCKASELTSVGSRMASCFPTAMWYMREARKNGK